MRVYPFGGAGGGLMRVAGWVAAGAAVAGMVAAGAAAAAPAAQAGVAAASTAAARAAQTGAAASPTAATTATPAVTATTMAAVTAASAPSGVRSRLAELADAVTGADLWSRSSVTKRPIGSITKVMTAYVVLETPGLKLNRVITVPAGITRYDAEYDASTAGLRPGEKLTTGQLLYAMLLPSGCDAAYTLAAAYGPGLAGFIARMNATAKNLGLAKTHFSDFSGLPDPGEYTTYSTAHDLIALGRAAMKLKTLASIVDTREVVVRAGAGHLAHTWKNLDPLLGSYSGAAGIKTGYTAAAGQCLLFEARRGNRTLIGVVLDSSPANSATLSAAGADATAMLNWGFGLRTIRRAATGAA
jgi:serine-type D-Ala-D-Ala carboxypeptidase (penicillin-binding protein 5/6)